MDGPQLLKVAMIDEPNGTLAVNESLPFVPVRVFSITGVPRAGRRGGHWHRWCHQVIWCVAGAVIVKLTGDSENMWPLTPGCMLHVPPLHLIDMAGFSETAVIVVLCSEKYVKPETSLELLKEERMIRFAVKEVIKHDDAETRQGTTSDRNDPRLRKTRADGQQEAYLVLSEEERAKGFVKPVFRKYVHLKCGTETVMSTAIAESYAARPSTYGATYCCHCGMHFPLRDPANGSFMFTWPDGTGVGSWPDIDVMKETPDD